jgi:LPS export ABC transporter protein LptC
MPDSSKKIKTILLIIIFLTLGTVLSIFIGFRILSQKPELLIDTIKKHVTLSIDNLHQTATRDGKPEWTLDAKSARLIQAENRSILEDLSVVFFMKNQKKAHLTANHGVLENNTNNFTVTGNVVLENAEYNLQTEELRYNHKDRIIYTITPADISGKSLHFSAEKIIFNLNSHQVQLEGKVNGTINGKIKF